MKWFIPVLLLCMAASADAQVSSTDQAQPVGVQKGWSCPDKSEVDQRAIFRKCARGCKLVEDQAPRYPPIARAAKARGKVIVEITVDEEGRVASARHISGHPLLIAPAMEAACKRRYRPLIISGHVAAFRTRVNLCPVAQAA